LTAEWVPSQLFPATAPAAGGDPSRLGTSLGNQGVTIMDQPGITRRSVLRLAGFGAAALAVGGAVAASPLAAGAAGATRRVVTPTRASGVSFARATFAPLVGRGFSVSTNGAWQTVVLDKIVDHPGAGQGESFSLQFNGATPAFGQGTYQVHEPSLGQFALFVTPINLPKQPQTYEAVINNRLNR
jgi:hypothetical protein